MRDLFNRISQDPNTNCELLPDGIKISSWQGEVLSPAVTLIFTDEEFHLFSDQITGADIDELWPGVTAHEAALRLVEVYLEEAIRIGSDQSSTLTLGHNGLNYHA